MVWYCSKHCISHTPSSYWWVWTGHHFAKYSSTTLAKPSSQPYSLWFAFPPKKENKQTKNVCFVAGMKKAQQCFKSILFLVTRAVLFYYMHAAWTLLFVLTIAFTNLVFVILKKIRLTIEAKAMMCLFRVHWSWLCMTILEDKINGGG